MKKKEDTSVRVKWKNRKIILYSVVLICLLVILIVSAINSYNNYHAYKSQRDYLKNSYSIKIESWMTPHTVLRHFNISQEDLLNILNITNTSLDFKKQISGICSKKKENCTLIVEELNKQVK